MFGLVKEKLIVLLSFSEFLATQCLFLNMTHTWLDLLLLI